MSRAISLDFNRDTQQMALVVQESLDRAYDLKNKEVAQIRKEVDSHFRQVGMLERRAMLVASRRKTQNRH